jgi:hypothetical protein
MPTKQNRGGRPPLPPGERKDRQVFISVTPAMYKALADKAQESGRSLAAEVVRRLSVTLQWPGWEAFEGPPISDQKLAPVGPVGPVVGTETWYDAIRGATGLMIAEEVERQLAQAQVTNRPRRGKKGRRQAQEGRCLVRLRK